MAFKRKRKKLTFMKRQKKTLNLIFTRKKLYLTSKH